MGDLLRGGSFAGREELIHNLYYYVCIHPVDCVFGMGDCGGL